MTYQHASVRDYVAAKQRGDTVTTDRIVREVGAGVTGETDEYHRLNDAVIAAGEKLPKRYKYLTKGV